LIGAHLEDVSLGETTRTDLTGKHFEVVKYEFEAVLRLEKWDDLDDLFQVGFHSPPNLSLTNDVRNAGVMTM
jgi:hypothetical protein